MVPLTVELPASAPSLPGPGAA